MLDYLYANNFIAAYNALKQDAETEYTPDPKAKYTGLLEKKWTSVIRLQKKVRCPNSCVRHVESTAHR
jgi:platelet-activating factor acetylhydrolase IB subunit alpha